MKKKYRNIMLIAVGVILLIMMVVQALSPVQAPGVLVVSKEYTESIKDEGVIYAALHQDLYAPQNLLVKAIYIKEGDYVEEGQLLLEFDDELIKKQFDANQTSLEMQIINLNAELSMAASEKNQYSLELTERVLASIRTQINSQRIVFESANNDYENAKILYGDGFIAKNELDQAAQLMHQEEALVSELQATYDKTKAQMESMRAHYEAVEEGLKVQIEAMEELLATGGTDAQSAQLSYLADQTSLRAPFSGKILSINARVGNMADTLAPVISLAKDDEIVMEAYLLAADAALVTVGMEVEVTVDGKEKKIIKGTVVTVSSYATEQLSALGIVESRVKVEMVLFNDEPVIVGQKADVEFIIQREPDGVGLPKACVFAYEDGYAVMKVERGKAVLVPVEKEFETDTMVVLKSGVADGDVVISTPSADGIKHGKGVRASYK